MEYEDSYLLHQLQKEGADHLDYQSVMPYENYNFHDNQQHDSVSIYLQEGSLLCLSCMHSAISQTISNLLFALLTANLSLLIIHRIFNGCHNIKNISTVLIGQATIYFHLLKNKSHDENKRGNVYLQALVPILITVITIISNTLSHYVRRCERLASIVSWFIGTATILLNEIFIHSGLTEFMVLRPILMVIAMKYISLNTDKVTWLEISAKKKNGTTTTKPSSGYFISILSDLAYLSHPASSILGAWHPRFEQSCSICSRNLVKAFYSLMKSFLYLVISTCVAGFLLDILRLALVCYVPTSQSWSDVLLQYLEIFIIALEFRFSHYFSCQLTYAMFLIWNHDVPVCQPCDIEMPRSLVQVVVSWNRPMHMWLKTYTFLPLREFTNSTILPVLSTYVFSSILHGFKFEIWSVLLLLGIYTWIEHHLRRVTAMQFNACVASRRCDTSRGGRICLRRHVNTEYGSIRAKLINASFSIVALAHLTFLGSCFHNNVDASGYDKVMTAWHELYFFSPTMAAIELVIFLASRPK